MRAGLFPFAAAGCCVLVAAAARDARAEAVLVDEVLAVVTLERARDSSTGREPVVTLGEVEVEARILASTERGPLALLDPLEPVMLSRALQTLIAELVLENEAERLQVYRVGASEAEAAAQRFVARHRKADFDRFRALHALDDASIARIFARKVRALKYLDGRFRLQSRPSEAEVRDALALRAAELTGVDAGTAAARVREELQRSKFTALADAYVADVRRRASVRVLRDPGSSRVETPQQGTVKASDVAKGPGGG